MLSRAIIRVDRGSRLAALMVWAVAGLMNASDASAAATGDGPVAAAPIVPLPPLQDRPYPGILRLNIDATDLERRIVHVHETLSTSGRETVLLYPRWLPGHHAPQGPIDRLAGLRVTSAGTPVAWRRDPVEVYAFRIAAKPGVKTLDLDFDYLSPTSPAVGPPEMSPDLLVLEWNDLVLYPAGYLDRRIEVEATVSMPADFKFATALDTRDSGEGTGAGTGTGGHAFARTTLETLIDSPLYAGRHSARFDLDPGAAVPVHLDLFADRPELLAVTPDQLAAHRALVQQAYRLFRSHHYAHYDFLYSLSDQVHYSGLEHHQSSEDGTDPESFTEWDKTVYVRDLLPHEFTHSWNGKFRRPADLWTPNYNVPMQDTLLWVYEGQTQYWGEVLAARSGLWSRQQALDKLALTAAYDDHQSGRRWRPLEDTTNDPIINPRRPMSWRDWQRFEDYYAEGALIWLDVDTLIRERSADKHSLDEFAGTFFGIGDGHMGTVTYTFDDVVRALNAVVPYDWASFLHARLDAVAQPAPLDGVRRGGYKLVYGDAPNALQKASDSQRKRVGLLYSIGVELDDKDRKGTVVQVMWDGPAAQAKMTEGAQILAVDGEAYSADLLKQAIRAAAGTAAPIELMIKTGDRFRVVALNYHDGLRYPRLERDPAVPARLDTILAARP